MSQTTTTPAPVEAPAATDVAIIPAGPTTIMGLSDVNAAMARAQEVAAAIQAIVSSSGFSIDLGGAQRHVTAEGWSALGGLVMLGIRVDGVDGHRDSNGKLGYRAKVSAITRDGEVVAQAWAICTREGRTWGRESVTDSALYSMAQTRATAKAYRVALSWLMRMAGFEGTPAEEMDDAAVVDAAAKREPTTAEAFAGWISKVSADDRAEIRARIEALGVKPGTRAVVDRFGDAAASLDTFAVALADAELATETPAETPDDVEILPPAEQESDNSPTARVRARRNATTTGEDS